MARRGPLPLPTAAKRLRGTLRKDRTNPGEPPTIPLGRTVKAPAWLDDDGTAAWARLVLLLKGTGVLGAQDLELLAVFADQIGTYERAARTLKEKGAQSFVVTDGDGAPKGIAAYPETKIKQAAAAEIRRLAEHFGLSPAARSRVLALVPSAPKDDPFAEFDKSPLARLQAQATAMITARGRGPQ